MANSGVFFLPSFGSVKKLFKKTMKAVLKRDENPCQTSQHEKQGESAHKSQRKSAHETQLDDLNSLEQLMQEQVYLNSQKKINLLRKSMRCSRKPHKKAAGSPLAGLSAELKFRLAEQVRKTSPNHLLWLGEWFFGPTSLAGAEWLLLSNRRNKPGAFLICERTGQHKREFVLSVLLSIPSADGSASRGALVKHFCVRSFYGYRISSFRAFNSLQDLIDYYSEEEREGFVRLGEACAMPRTREYARL